jgi:hypothetical protein
MIDMTHSYALTKLGIVLAVFGVIAKLVFLLTDYPLSFDSTGTFLLVLAVFLVVMDIAKAVEKD